VNHVSLTAYIALALVVPFSIVAFALLDVRHAVLSILLGSFLFLPSGLIVDLPAIPPFDKQTIPALCVLVGLLVTGRDRIRAARLGRGIDVLCIIVLLGTIGTVLTNGDALRYGPTRLPALSHADAISDATYALLGLVIPFFVGRAVFRTAEDARELMRAIVLSCVVYLPFILVELKMSPQWHNWVYGYFPHAFAQTIRSSGYRPQVFMNHGLVLALFVATGMMSAWTLARAGARTFGVSSRPIAWVLTVLLALMNSLGALIYGILHAPLIRFASPKAQLRLAVFLGALAFTYPLLRLVDIFPADALVDLAADYSEERAESLDFRFRNEAQLLDRALERPFFGWGGWGRNRIFDEWGNDICISDGLWVIELGAGGLVKFTAEFGLMLLPLIAALRRIDRVQPADRPLLASLGLIAAIHVVDLLPNAGCGNLYMFLPGAVAGLAEGMPNESRQSPALLAVIRALAILRRAVTAQRGSVG
jgi:hypothetical protein